MKSFYSLTLLLSSLVLLGFGCQNTPKPEDIYIEYTPSETEQPATEQSAEEKSKVTAEVGSEYLLPDFYLKQLGAGPITRNDIGGQNAVYFFWDTDCGNCLEQFELLEKVKAKHEDVYGDSFIFVYISRGETEQAVQDFVTKHDLSETDYIFLIDEADALHKQMAFDAQVYVVNTKNQLVFQSAGLINPEHLPKIMAMLE